MRFERIVPAKNAWLSMKAIGRVNASPWRGCDARTLLVSGVSGEMKSSGMCRQEWHLIPIDKHHINHVEAGGHEPVTFLRHVVDPSEAYGCVEFPDDLVAMTPEGDF